MKFFAIVASVSMLAIGCQGKVASQPEASESVQATPATFNTEGAPTVSFDVPDMMCQYSCVDAVKTALSEQPGVKEVKIDFETKQATVAVDEAKFDSEAAVATLVDYQFSNSKLHADK